jgi:hypothetical protein
MQLTQQVGMQAFRPATMLELLKKFPELFVSQLVLRMGRTPISFHAVLLKPEMGFGIRLEEINQVEQEFSLLPGRIRIGQHALQMIGVVNQHPVLLIDRAGTDNELVIPEYHDKLLFAWPSGPVTGHHPPLQPDNPAQALRPILILDGCKARTTDFLVNIDRLLHLHPIAVPGRPG